MEKSEKLKNLVDRRAYKLLTTIDQDPYSFAYECWRVRRTWGKYESRKWKKKEIYWYQYRMYRTWKYNRKTKWK